ncbi:MAG: hypothetical protein HOJ48_15990 [Desulfobacula sp.]|jgi:hypothetical protein|nr:hypothetical protein [Desulfobacula sp.]MBT7262127.1 hypothetical protein [Desulfobacula sp.]
MMKIIPQEVLNRFNAQLIKAGVPPKDHTFFKKWLRYYVDFCLKYGQSSALSVAVFASRNR